MAEEIQLPASEPKAMPSEIQPLESVTHLFIKQMVEVTEILMGFETKNKYEIVNGKNERLYYAVETTNYCLVCCCKTTRPFKFNVLDYTGKQVMKIQRDCTCTSCCCCCNCQLCCCGLFNYSKVNIKLADDTLLGQITEGCSIFTPNYNVKNGDKVKKLTINGPSCAFCCNCKLLGNVEFEIHSVDGNKEQCGRISKEFDGFNDIITRGRSDADNYGISFPVDMDPMMKATLLGAVLLIDFEYFEAAGGHEPNKGRTSQ